MPRSTWGPGCPRSRSSGLPDLAVQEARERVRSALRAAGFELPNARIVVNLAPGPLRKHGTGFDLALAVGLLTATRQLPPSIARDCAIVGELSLDGSVRSVHGMLAHALAARAQTQATSRSRRGRPSLSLQDLDYRPVGHLAQLRSGVPEQATIAGRLHAAALVTAPTSPTWPVTNWRSARFSIAAAGGHNVLMIGPPGFGQDDARAAPADDPAAARRSRATGDGARALRRGPGRCARARRASGRFGRHTTRPRSRVSSAEARLHARERRRWRTTGCCSSTRCPSSAPRRCRRLRQPLEDGQITLVRAEGRLRFPARFALVGAANPCPCGFRGDPQRRCTCAPGMVERYQGRIGGPLMDRIDLVIDVARIDPGLLLGSPQRRQLGAHARAGSGRTRAAPSVAGGGPTATLAGVELLEACCSVPALAALPRGVGPGAAPLGPGSDAAAPGRSHVRRHIRRRVGGSRSPRRGARLPRAERRAVMRTLRQHAPRFELSLGEPELPARSSPSRPTRPRCSTGSATRPTCGRGSRSSARARRRRTGCRRQPVRGLGRAGGLHRHLGRSDRLRSGRTPRRPRRTGRRRWRCSAAAPTSSIRPTRPSLLAQIARSGAIVSEQPWGTPPQRWTFRTRNRIIAGLSAGLLVLEAGLPSGTFSTADYALAAGRDVFVVPGSIFAPECRGANRLLHQGATPVSDVTELAEVAGRRAAASPPTRGADRWHLGVAGDRRSSARCAADPPLASRRSRSGARARHRDRRAPHRRARNRGTGRPLR